LVVDALIVVPTNNQFFFSISPHQKIPPPTTPHDCLEEHFFVEKKTKKL